MRKFQMMFGLLMLATLFILMGQAASAQQNCAPRDLVAERLNDHYGEAVQSRGLTEDGQALVETWANTESGSWTVTVTNTQGVTCLVVSGQMFENVYEEVEGEAL
jgi:hypothetical protein